MRVLVGVAHPKQVHMFKNLAGQMMKNGHEIKCVAIEKEVTRKLLDDLHIPYFLIGKNPDKIYEKLLGLPVWEYLTYNIVKNFRPDIYIGQALPHFAHVSSLFRKPYVIFEDTESAIIVQKICFPFASSIITPACYKADHGHKHVRFNGFYELSYLHPDYFSPDPTILNELGLDKNDRYIVIRSVSWNAIHDVGQKGFTTELIREAVKKLEPFGKIFITSEAALPGDLRRYRITVPANKIHDLLYYATLFIGDSGTMATESAVLGTPAIRLSAFNYNNELGNFVELENKYRLIYSLNDPRKAIEKALELLSSGHIKEEWGRKRKALLNDTIDVNRFMIDLIENYPDSIDRYRTYKARDNG